MDLQRVSIWPRLRRRALRASEPFADAEAAARFVEAHGPGSRFHCRINGAERIAPYEMLRLWPECWITDAQQPLAYEVESLVSGWLCARVRYGHHVLDVGAAFGVISLALSERVGRRGRVHALEPARLTRGHLYGVLEANRRRNVRISSEALSDQQGEALFTEYTASNALSWASDTSTLSEGRAPDKPGHEEYAVPVTTLDRYVVEHALRPRAIKMDIEGMEVYALQGGLGTLKHHRPALAIDVHLDARTGEPTEPRVRALLETVGYREIAFEHHTIFAD